MKKIFLTSGVILCMACPAMATTDIAADANSSSCVNDVLGSYTGPVSFEAKWLPRVSGAITLNSDLYRSNEANATPVYTGSTSPAVSAATQTPLYSVYGVGLYTTQVTSTNYTNSTPVTTLNPKPSLTGHTFTGFYTDKASNGTQVIDGDGVVLPAALVQISTAGTSATWYAGYNPHISGAIALDSSVYPDGNANTAATYATSGTSELVTASNPTSLYSVYGVNLYSSAVTLQNYKNATPTTQITVPSKVGYDFLGFYTAKYSGGTQMINNTGAVQTAAKSQITDDNDTATWYAHWNPITYSGSDGVTYNAGSHGTGTAVTQDVTYDAAWTTKTFAQSGFTETAGYTFSKWNTAADGTGTDYSAGAEQNPWKSTSALSLYAIYTSNVSGAITFNANYYKTQNQAANSPTYSVTAPASVYSVYNVGMYANSTDAGNQTNAISGITAPTMVGYTFEGFYTEQQYKGSNNGTQVVAANGSFTADAKTQVTSTGGTPTWYAKWAQNERVITYTCGTKPSSAAQNNNITGYTDSNLSENLVQKQTYDETFTLATTPGSCALSGYHFAGWKCNYTLTDGNEYTGTTANYASALSNNTQHHT